MRNLVLSLMLFCFFKTTLSQPVIEIDLAENSPEMTYTFPSAPTTITQFKLLNCLPGKDYRYTINVNKKVMENKPFSSAEFTGLASDFQSVKIAIRIAVAAETMRAQDTTKVQRLLKICDQLITTLSKLSNAVDEQSIPLLKSEAEAAYRMVEENKVSIDSLKTVVHNATIEQFITKASEAYTKAPKIIEKTEMTSKPVLPIVVEDNEMLIVTVVRYKNLKVEKKWEVKIKGSEPSRWKLYYGFTFAPNRWNNFKSYYLKATEVSNVVYAKDGLGNIIDTTVTTATKYAVTEKHNQSRFWADLSPTVLFTYRPFEKRKCDFGITAGLSTDLNTRAALFLGASLVIGDNINLNLGYGAIKKNMLKGEYEEGQLLDESNVALEESQCMGGIMISLGFRFDKKPKTSTSSNQSNSVAEENINHDTDSSEEENSSNNSSQPVNSNTTNTGNSPPPANTGENNNNNGNTDDSFTNSPH